jgi:hypothetical protein
VDVDIVNDAVSEPVETFVVNLSGATGGATIGDNQGVGTITDDEQSALSINDVVVTEGAGPAGFTVSLTPASSQTVTVDWATANGTAQAGSDYTAASGTVTFTPGQTSRPVNVTVASDGLDESSETFVVNLSGATGGATISDNQGVATILDNDPPPTLSINDVTVTEGPGVTAGFTVSLSKESGLTVSVNWATANQSAQAGSDYTAASGTVTFTPGQTTRPVNVTILDDSSPEDDETFAVTLSGPVNATIADGQGVGTIQDDGDTPPPATDGFATGTGGRNWRYNGTSWVSQSLICSCNLFGVWGTSIGDVFAVGTNSVIMHFSSGSWSSQTSAQTMTNRAVWASPSNDVFIVGEGGTRIQHYNGTGWSTQASGLDLGGLYGVAGTSSTNVFAVGWDGSAGVILRYNGSSWSPMTHGATVTLDGVWAAAPNDVFVVGDGGTILHYNGTSWSTMTSGTTVNLNDVWGTSSNNVIAVGENGTTLHYNGSSWQPKDSGTSNVLLGMWGTSSTDAYAVGGVATFIRFDGTSWNDQSLTGNLNILDVWVP